MSLHYKEKQVLSGKTILGIAPIEFANDLLPLYKSKSELDSIGVDRALLQYQANKENTIKALLEHYIIHFSTHASDSAIYLFDSLLEIEFLYTINIAAKMVTLSACNTSTGKLKEGGGVMSIAHAFAYSGCPSTLSTLWEVDQTATTKMMSIFYKNLRQGLSKDKALKKAKLEYIKRVSKSRRDPYYWAGLIHIGDTAPLYDSPRATPWWMYLLGGILIISIIYLFTFRKPLKNTVSFN